MDDMAALARDVKVTWALAFRASPRTVPLTVTRPGTHLTG